MSRSNRLLSALGALGLSGDLPEILGVNTLEHAGPSDLCFSEDRTASERVAGSSAGLILVALDFPDLPNAPLLRVPDPRGCFFELAELFLPEPHFGGIHPQAVIHETVSLGEDVAVDACAVIAAGAMIGSRSRIGAGAQIGPNVRLGEDCVIGCNVSVLYDTEIGDRCVIHPGTVVGGDGFGFRWDGKGHRKVPQVGRVVIESDVEIGCNSCVDRATLGVTRVGRGTKIDNLVQVAHNVTVGPHSILVSQCGIAGSSTLGAGVVLAGQVAVSDHLTVGDGAQIGGQAGVVRDVAPKEALFGTPARPVKQALRESAALAKLPDLAKQVKRQQALIDELTERLAALESAQS